MPASTSQLFSERYWDNALAIGDALREQAPVHLAKLPNHVRAWVITRYEDARQALADPRLSKDAEQLTRLLRDQLAAAGITTELSNLFDPHMLFQDGADHARLRRLVAADFTPRRVAELLPRVQQITTDLLDNLQGERSVDLVDQFAFPLPLIVICELLGIPVQDRGRLRDWTFALMEDRPEITVPASRAMRAYVTALIDDKRHDPGDDLISALVSTRHGADQLTGPELMGTVFLLIVAGHETTTNLITNGVRWLLDDRSRWTALSRNPELVPGAVDELLRFDSPVRMATFRFTTEPVTFDDTTLPAGEIVLVSLHSANRDPDAFPHAEQLDLHRDTRGHLSFGRGAHHCLGARLGRLEAEIALTELTARFPHARLACDPAELRYQRSVIMNGLQHLHVMLDPRGTMTPAGSLDRVCSG